MKRLFALLLAAVAAATAQPAEPLSWLGSTEIAAGRAERGPWRMNESRFDYVDDPSVALDDQGEAAVVWVDQARKDVFFQRISATGARLGESVNVSRLANAVEDQLSASFEYTSFDDYWSAFLTGQGKTGSYVTSLGDPQRKELERHVRAAYLCGMTDGPRSLITLFWAVRDEVIA